MSLRWPRTLAARLVALALLAVVGAQLLAFWIFSDERRLAIETVRGERIVEQLAPVVRALAVTPSDAHPAVVAALSGRPLALSLDREPSVGAGGRRADHPLAQRLLRDLGPLVATVHVQAVARPDRRQRSEDEDERPLPWRRAHRIAAVSLALAEGGWLNARVDPVPSPPDFARPYGVMLALLAGLLVMAVLVGSRRATRPLAELAAAAERLGRGEPTPPLDTRGPDEIRVAIDAFNRMQERLARFIADRTRLLAALGHDLRTPITSLRLRAELLDDEDARTRMVATLDEMGRMVEATLAFARDEAADEAVRDIDLCALVEGVAADLIELGRDVVVRESPRLVVSARPAGLRRAVRNLIENAVAYGKRAKVSVAPMGAEAFVVIDDEGPGIPEDKIEQVFEPFFRLEGSRSIDTGGIGLGLSIARSIARRHGGDVTLSNLPEGGLRSLLRLPSSVRGGGAQR